MKGNHKLNLYNISSIFGLFIIVIVIYIFINVFKIINIVNLPDNKINVVKKDTGIHHIIEGRFTTIDNTTFSIPEDLATEEILDIMLDIVNEKPKTYYKNILLLNQVFVLVWSLMFWIFIFIFYNITNIYLEYFTPFTKEILNKVQNLQKFFLLMTALGVFLGILKMFYRNINLNSLLYNPFLNFIFFSCSYLVGSIIENGIENLKIS